MYVKYKINIHPDNNYLKLFSYRQTKREVVQIKSPKVSKDLTREFFAHK